MHLERERPAGGIIRQVVAHVRILLRFHQFTHQRRKLLVEGHDPGAGRIRDAVVRGRRAKLHNANAQEREPSQQLDRRRVVALLLRHDPGVRPGGTMGGDRVTARLVPVVQQLLAEPRRIPEGGDRRRDHVIHLVPERPAPLLPRAVVHRCRQQRAIVRRELVHC